MAHSKVIIGDEVLIDLEHDTVKADKILKGYTAHQNDGEPITGTCDFDANTQDATATEDEVVSGRTFYKQGKKCSGKMPYKGQFNGVIAEKGNKFPIPQGYHDGSGIVQIAEDEQLNIIPENIREGVTILGVEGTMSGSEGVKAQSKNITPSMSQQTVVPDSGFTHLAQVTVAPIPYKEVVNSSGGTTVIIG